MNTAVNTQRTPIRFGVLGAANINLNAIINPCFTSPEDAKITALAARDPARKRGTYSYCQHYTSPRVNVYMKSL